ncbi:15067_t:CDS:2 [Funneliformis geosporum]|uniref:3984_t:CDS:1 n=1 Tax=Funneliformis geosporum TaxID=1117311 RepID=A0A9W4SBF5_9GLOM|nr:15067_t:CDS:2 [Funneliformis geosporum]CAI2162857.1 3984_t:CDS:2 [Funneliformis geosporum]
MSLTKMDEDNKELLNGIMDEISPGSINIRDFSRDLLSGDSGIPSVDVHQDDKAWVAKIKLDGIDKDDIEVEVKDDSLIVRGEYNETSENTTDDGTIREIKSSSFSRSISIPEGFNTKSVDKKYDDIYLNVTVEKE